MRKTALLMGILMVAGNPVVAQDGIDVRIKNELKSIEDIQKRATLQEKIQEIRQRQMKKFLPQDKLGSLNQQQRERLVDKFATHYQTREEALRKRLSQKDTSN